MKELQFREKKNNIGERKMAARKLGARRARGNVLLTAFGLISVFRS